MKFSAKQRMGAVAAGTEAFKNWRCLWAVDPSKQTNVIQCVIDAAEAEATALGVSSKALEDREARRHFAHRVRERCKDEVCGFIGMILLMAFLSFLIQKILWELFP